MFQPNMFEGQSSMLDMNELMNMGNEENQMRYRTEATEDPSDDDRDPNQRGKRMRNHRHTKRQIDHLEAFFKQCPHPDDKQRKELSYELGLEPLQIKFWFQNKRTQMKAAMERRENGILKEENEKLRAENSLYRKALSNASCLNCGGAAAGLGDMFFDEHHLKIENARLREEIDRILATAAKYMSRPMSSFPNFYPNVPSGALDLGIGNFASHSGCVGEMHGAMDAHKSMALPSEADKPMTVELAVAAMEELMKLAQVGDPLWITNENNNETLNEEEYFRAFPREIGPKPLGLRSEASKESAVVNINHVKLVKILMDANQWSSMFCGIVSRANILEVLSTGTAGNHDGALQVMTAEFQVPTPLVPTRETYFVRYCKQHSDGAWAVVDVSLDDLCPSSVLRSRKRPSGCLIQAMPDDYSQVTWVEHFEVQDISIHHLYRQLVDSGLAFGAKRWLATLDRQSDRLASSMADHILAGDILSTSADGRRSMLKLAARMVHSFHASVGASTPDAWTMLSSDSDDVRIMTLNSINNPGRPQGVVLSAATSFWIPINPKQMFDFLRDENHRGEWDSLLNGEKVEEIARIANGRDPGNCVSLLKVNDDNSGQFKVMLQETRTDCTGSYVVFGPVDAHSMNGVLNGSDPDYVPLLPSGFAILPHGPGYGSGSDQSIANVGSGESLLTVALQILVDSTPTAKLCVDSVASINNLIQFTVERIKAAVASQNA